jgi:hypothetical protein
MMRTIAILLATCSKALTGCAYAQPFAKATEAAGADRCATSICLDSDDGWISLVGIEPLMEFPVYKSLSSNRTRLGRYLISHGYSGAFTVGLRVWGHYDLVSHSARLQASADRHCQAQACGRLPRVPAQPSWSSRWFPFACITLLGREDAD